MSYYEVTKICVDILQYCIQLYYDTYSAFRYTQHATIVRENAMEPTWTKAINNIHYNNIYESLICKFIRRTALKFNFY